MTVSSSARSEFKTVSNFSLPFIFVFLYNCVNNILKFILHVLSLLLKRVNRRDSSGTYFLNLLMIKKITPKITNTSIIPAHTPTLNIPSITAHPEKINVVIDITIRYKGTFPMIFPMFFLRHNFSKVILLFQL